MALLKAELLSVSLSLAPSLFLSLLLSSSVLRPPLSEDFRSWGWPDLVLPALRPLSGSSATGRTTPQRGCAARRLKIARFCFRAAWVTGAVCSRAGRGNFIKHGYVQTGCAEKLCYITVALSGRDGAAGACPRVIAERNKNTAPAASQELPTQ